MPLDIYMKRAVIAWMDEGHSVAGICRMFIERFGNDLDPADINEWIRQVSGLMEDYHRWGYDGPRLWTYQCTACDIRCQLSTAKNMGAPDGCLWELMFTRDDNQPNWVLVEDEQDSVAPNSGGEAKCL